MSSYDYICIYTCDYNAHQYVHTWWPENVTCGSLKMSHMVVQECDLWHHLDFLKKLPKKYFHFFQPSN